MGCLSNIDTDFISFVFVSYHYVVYAYVSMLHNIFTYLIFLPGGHCDKNVNLATHIK